MKYFPIYIIAFFFVAMFALYMLPSLQPAQPIANSPVQPTAKYIQVDENAPKVYFTVIVTKVEGESAWCGENFMIHKVGKIYEVGDTIAIQIPY